MSFALDMVSQIIYYLRESTESAAVQEQPELVVNVRARRQALGLTQQQLAERAGISRQTLVAIEAGRLIPARSASCCWVNGGPYRFPRARTSPESARRSSPGRPGTRAVKRRG